MQNHQFKNSNNAYFYNKAKDRAVPHIRPNFSKNGNFSQGTKEKLENFTRLRIEEQSKEGYHDKWHGLLEVSSQKILKFVAMSTRESRERNRVLAGTGFAWAQCNPPS